MALKITFPQSEANNADAALLEALLSGTPKLRALRGQSRIGSGFSGCRVYIMLAEFGTEAGHPWIVKVGTRAEIEAEAENFLTAAAHIKGPNLVTKLDARFGGENGVLLFSYAGYSGRAPRDLAALLPKPEALEAIRSTVNMVEGWLTSISWRKSNLVQSLKGWLAQKLQNVPEGIRKSENARSILSPDFGEVYSNPMHFLVHGARASEVVCPFGFTHGDLNLRNVLFNVTDGNRPDTALPLIIDTRHATDEQYAIVDLAKLEACLRYEHIGRIETAADMEQVVSFLQSSRLALELGPPPDVIADKRLQELWREISTIRAAASRVFKTHQESEPCYWATLAAYGVSTSTYNNLSSTIRHFAYLDAAAILTRYLVPRDPTAPQHIIAVHESFSPPVIASPPPPEEYRNLPLLADAVREGRCLLVVGSLFGKTAGVEPMLPFLQRVFKDVTGEAAASSSTAVLGEALTRKATRPRILSAIRQRISAWGEPVEAKDLARIRSAAVLTVHYHDKVIASLRSSSVIGVVKRVDCIDDATQAFDDIVAGATPYLPLSGDVESSPESIVLTRADRKQRGDMFNSVAQALSRRNVPLAITFWRCEEMSVDDLLVVRDEISEGLTVPYDCFYVTDVDDAVRDASLRDIGFWRVKRTLAELVDVAGVATPQLIAGAIAWDDGATVFTLPDVSRLSRGLLLRYTEAGTVSGHVTMDDAGSFLLGSPATDQDILEQRVVKRLVIERDVLPAVRTELGSHTHRVRLVLLSGRAGAGISSVLCYVAHMLEKERVAPVFVVARSAARSGEEWRSVASLLRETSKAISRPVVVVFDAHDGTRKELQALADAAVEIGADIVAIVGGRKDIIDVLKEQMGPIQRQHLHLADHLTRDECASLARVLQHNGFCADKSAIELERQLLHAKFLLPAIYEATDRANRKFSDIVLQEYRRYESEQLVQRAYRLICIATWLGQRISQYWMLKILGPHGRADAARILGRLSDDIIIELPAGVSDPTRGEAWVAARHSLIAEEVLNVSVPEPSHRFVDIEQLIGAANTGSETEGTIVASLLSHKGVLSRWVRREFEYSSAEQLRRLSDLYDAALTSGPVHPRIERDLRQHYALMLRSFDKYDDALVHASMAARLDPGNPATAHILGLIHERRAVDGWRQWASSGCSSQPDLNAAERNEQDAIEFFRESRTLHARNEHGYESEARYYLRKFEALEHGAKFEHGRDIKHRASEQLLAGLWLIETAEAVLPRSKLIESPKTKARLLAAVGNYDAAISTLQTAVKRNQDPVRGAQLRRALAVIAILTRRYTEAIAVLGELIAAGDRLPEVFLMRDDALRAIDTPLSEREAMFRESAEEWNRRDMETLIRWAELRLYRSDWEGATRVLRRADDAARVALSGFAREESRGVLRTSATSSEERRFTGTVQRLWKPYEGQVSFSGISEGVFFTTDRNFGNVQVGDRVSYSLSWRVRGLRAVRIERVS